METIKVQSITKVDNTSPENQNNRAILLANFANKILTIINKLPEAELETINTKEINFPPIGENKDEYVFLSATIKCTAGKAFETARIIWDDTGTWDETLVNIWNESTGIGAGYSSLPDEYEEFTDNFLAEN